MLKKKTTINLMDKKKVRLGQYFTKETSWLKPQVKDFIITSNCTVAFDPFAGAGDLLKVAKEKLGFKEIVGLDIDDKLKWGINDSLLNIPHYNNAIIITNPPYIAKQSASRKKIDLTKYWDITQYDDVYLLALDKMIQAQKKIVAIIPESFINSNYQRKDLISSITVLEENPFDDTENPVCVVCFDGISKSKKEISIFKNDKLINNLDNIEKIRIEPDNDIKITFNTLKGWLGLRAIDSTNDKKLISFDFKDKIFNLGLILRKSYCN